MLCFVLFQSILVASRLILSVCEGSRKEIICVFKQTPKVGSLRLGSVGSVLFPLPHVSFYFLFPV